MAVMARELWTDERLDDLNKKVDNGFTRIDGDLREIRGEMKDLREEVTGLRGEMHDRFESLNRTLIGAVAVIVAALIGSSATLAGIALF